VQTLEDWLSASASAPRWIVPGLLPAESLILISGPRKLGHKTWLTDLFALYTSTGVACKSGEILPINAEPVLYIEEEGSRAGTRNRLLSLRQSLGLKDVKLDNIYYVFRQSVKLDTERWVSRIENVISELGIKLVIFDAFAYIHSVNENSSEDLKKVIQSFQRFRALGASVIFIAHTSKNADVSDIDNQVRGSGLIVDCYDLHLALRSKGKGKKLTLETRAREFEGDRYEVRWAFNSQGDGELLDVNLELIDLDVGKNVSEMGECLEMGVQYSHRELREVWKIGEEKVQLAVAKMLRRGIIRMERGKVERI